MITKSNLANLKKSLSLLHPDLSVSDEKGKFILICDGFEDYYGYKANDLIGTDLEQRHSLGFADKSITREVIMQKQCIIMPLQNRSGSNLLTVGCPIFDKDNNLRYVASWTVSNGNLIAVDKEREELENLLLALNITTKVLPADYRILDEKTQTIINLIKDYNTTLLITGPTGVGKSTLAKYIHSSSNRSNKPFVTVSCGAIPENLIESELFGYTGGVFTGGQKNGKAGRIEEADGGTLFLDEIAELPYHLQSKLLQTIQEKTVTRLGSSIPIHVDVRIIAATNRDLMELVSKGLFREDLYYRLNVVPIELPSLAGNHERILSLIDYYQMVFNKKYGQNKKFSQEALSKLVEWKWPGNIREIENTIERMIIISSEDVIEANQLPDEILKIPMGNFTIVDNTQLSFDTLMEAYECKIIREAYAKYKTSAEVAKQLGLSQSSAWRKIKKYCLD